MNFLLCAGAILFDVIVFLGCLIWCIKRRGEGRQELVDEMEVEDERLRKLEEEKERLRKLEEEKERLRKLEEEKERLRKLEQDRLQKLEQERLQKLEQERLQKLEQERLQKLEQERQEQIIKQDVQPIAQQTSIQQQIHSQPIKQQIQSLTQEINKIDNNNNLTNNKKQYYKQQYQQQLFTKLKDQGEAKSIPHVKQNIVASNPEVVLYVLKESLLRDQNRELLQTSKQYSFGLDSIIGAYGQDQSCLSVRNTNLDYDKIVKDSQLLQQNILEFKQKLSSSLNVPMDQIEILGVSKGSFKIEFKINGKNKDQILQDIQSKPDAQNFLNTYCNGNIEQVAYFDKARADAYNMVQQPALGVTLSTDDFNPKHNRNWDGFNEKEQRGPPYHRYDYYFPIGCQGFGLNVIKYGDNQDWIQMDGNPNEWRIMYHGTKNFAVNAIVKNNLKPGQAQAHANDDCIDEFGNKVKVGNGIYFSNDFNVCIKDGYATYTTIGDKQFAVIFMSRVNPKKIRQSDQMKSKKYFVVNNSDDVRPYRILLHEKK